jgi:hypothetical protein
MQKQLMAVTMFVLGALAVVVSQQVGQTAPALTALDYEEIRQLYARYAVAGDTAAQDGEMFARVFTEDGVFDMSPPPNAESSAVQGYDQLKATVKAIDAFRVGRGINDTPTHYVPNILIEPTAEGAMGVAYSVEMFADTATPAMSFGNYRLGTYHDQLVKTPEGWRFKKRTFTAGAFSDEVLQALEQ